MDLAPHDLEELRLAKQLLENPSFGARLVSVLGRPLELGLERLPAGASGLIQKATHKALERGLDVAVRSLDPSRRDAASDDRRHRAATGISGALGGAFGLNALALELPFTTTLMLRSIADIARSHGEDLERVEARLACLSVFALGGRSQGDDAAETGYFAIRAILAQQIADAARVLATRGLSERNAPILLRLLSSIASRFGIVVSEKAAAQLVPIVGGIGGAVVNVVFTEHFQNMAHGHFTIRHLERTYGSEQIRAAYDQL
jgi:hypothetical protein